MYRSVYKVQPFDCVFILQPRYITKHMFKQCGVEPRQLDTHWEGFEKVFEFKLLGITHSLQQVTADCSRQPLESSDRVRACNVSISSSLSASYLSYNLLLLCVVVLYRCKLNCLIENPSACEIRVVIGILNGKESPCIRIFSAYMFCLLANYNERCSALDN
jgi:hypothetical protein